MLLLISDLISSTINLIHSRRIRKTKSSFCATNAARFTVKTEKPATKMSAVKIWEKTVPITFVPQLMLKTDTVFQRQ